MFKQLEKFRQWYLDQTPYDKVPLAALIVVAILVLWFMGAILYHLITTNPTALIPITCVLGSIILFFYWIFSGKEED